MPKQNPNFEYFGDTLFAKLYAPDGSIFKVLSPGDEATSYLRKGYKLAPDDVWIAANEEYERAKAESLRISNAQREIKLKEKELERRAEEKRISDEIERIERELAEREAALNAPDPEPEPPKPKPKAKAKAKPKAAA